MSAIDMIGAIEPWPSARASLPDGWSWGDNPEIARVQAHKSRLILQADALSNLIAPEPEDRILMHALYRGAAEWELWLLAHDTRAPIEEKRRCTHSALSLAELSGDLNLAKRVLARWREIGPTHARFYRDGEKLLGARLPAFERQILALRVAVNALVDQRDPHAAERFLSATESFVVEGGSGEVAAMRALAMEVLGFPKAKVVDARFVVCVAFPTAPHAISAYLLVLSRLAPDIAPPSALADGLRWFRDHLGVQTSALALRDTRDDDAFFGEPIADHVARVARLALESNNTNDVDYAIFYCVKFLLLRESRMAEALALVDAALGKHPHAPIIRVFRALIANNLGQSGAFEDLSVMLREPHGVHVPEWLWLVAGEVFLRGRHWGDAVSAFRRGGVDALTFSESLWLNQYAVALAHSGAPDAARDALERAARISPDEAILRHNLAVLRGELDEALTRHEIDPFAAARILPELDRREYPLAA